MSYCFLGKKISFDEVLEIEKQGKRVRTDSSEDHQSFDCTSNCFRKLDFSLVSFLDLVRITGFLSPDLASVKRLATTCIRSKDAFGPEGGTIKGVVEFSKPKKRIRPDKLYFNINWFEPQYVVFYLDSLGPKVKESDCWKRIVEIGRKYGATESVDDLALTCPSKCFTVEYINDLVIALEKPIASVFWNAGMMGAADKDFIDTILSNNFDADHYTLELGGNFTSALFIKEFQKIMDEKSRCFYSLCPIVLKEPQKKRDKKSAINFGVTFTRDEYQYAAISTVPLHEDSGIPLERAQKLIDELGIDIKKPVKKEEVLRETTEDF